MNQTGKILHDLAPDETNMRNSEGAFVTLKDGSLLFAYSRYSGKGFRDESGADIAAITSADDGETWSEPQILFSAASHGTENIMSVSLLRLGSADIGIFYLIKHGFQDTRLVMRRSKDEGLTWSEAAYCIERLGFNVVNNDRVVLLSSGRLIFGAAHHGEVLQERRGNPFPVAVDYFYYSDDDGKNWLEAAACVALNSPYCLSGLQEPGLIELREGVLWAWARTDMGRQYEFYSFDNGCTWSNPQPSRFTSPCSPLSMKRIPGTEKLLAVWNPIPNYPTFKEDFTARDRKRLVYSISDDNGGIWNEPVILEDENGSGYCYTAIHFNKDYILLAYCAGSDEKDYSILSRLRIRKINSAELIK